MPTLDHFLKVRRMLIGAKRAYYRRFWGMRIHPTATFSLQAYFDRTNPKGVVVDEEAYIAFGATILTHDMTRRISRETRIGRRCFIGARSIIMPGVTIGAESIVGTGSVVTRDVPPHSVVAGNPASIIRTGIRLGPYGFILAEGEQA